VVYFGKVQYQIGLKNTFSDYIRMPYKNPDDRKAKQKAYYEANKEKRKAYNKARYAALKEALGDTKLTVKLPEPSSTPQCPDNTSSDPS